MTSELLQLFQRVVTRQQYLDAVVGALRAWSGCECVGIRIEDDAGRLTYEAHAGFDDGFLESEGSLRLDHADCICTRTALGTALESDRPCLTAAGSFRCDDTPAFSAGLDERQREGYRGHCFRQTFASLAAIPIRYRDRTRGLIHLADRRAGAIPPATVEFLEYLVPLIGEAIHRYDTEAELERHRAHLEELVASRTIELQHTAAELERSNRDLEQFASAVSHDLKEPLRAVAGYATLLQRKYGGLFDDKGDAYLAGAVDGAERMQRLIDDLLSYSRVGSRGGEVKPTDAEAALTAAVGEPAGGHRGGGRRPDARPPAHDPFGPLAASPALPEPDRERGQVPRGRDPADPRRRRAGSGAVALLGARQRHRHRAAVRGAHLRDLPAAAPAQRLPRDRDRAGDLQADRGAPWRPDLGRVGAGPGRDLLLHRPRRRRGAEVTPVRVRPLRVLLVEDSPSDAALLEATLAEAPEPVTVANAGTLQRAVALAREEAFDAILLDLTLPDCQGRETVARARVAWPELPVVVLTGAEDEELGFEAIRLGLQDYLVKGQAGGAMIVRALRYAVERKRAENEILRMKDELERRVEERTAQLRQLALKLTIAEEEERRRLAEQLHDSLQQLLVYAHLTVGEARTLAREERLRQSLERVERGLAEAIEVSRTLTTELSPPLLYERGLLAAVRGVSERMRERVGLAVELRAAAAAEPRHEIVRVLLFQSIRELLANVVKHAGVRKAVVEIDRGEDAIRVTVSDQGRGFEPGGQEGRGSAGGFGLFSIRERLRQLGGAFEVESAPGRGTRVTLRVPDTGAADATAPRRTQPGGRPDPGRGGADQVAIRPRFAA